MKPGEIVETSIWLSGAETQEMQSRFKQDAENFLNELCDVAHVLHGPIRWTTLNPGDDRVPAVPDHIQGPDVRLLVAEADILANKPHLSARARSFIGDLDLIDLERLRSITRKAYANHFPGQSLSDMECDDIIDELGPEAALETLRGETVH